jgi:hypothetical protein
MFLRGLVDGGAGLYEWCMIWVHWSAGYRVLVCFGRGCGCCGGAFKGRFGSVGGWVLGGGV